MEISMGFCKVRVYIIKIYIAITICGFSRARMHLEALSLIRQCSRDVDDVASMVLDNRQ